MKLIYGAALAFALSTATASASTIIYADVVIDYYHSGTAGGAEGSYAPGYGFGGPPNASTVPLTNATDQSLNTFVSLPTGSYITLGFSQGYIFDAPGQDDLFVNETGDASETAELWLSTDWGGSFTYLTTLFGNQTTSVDFAAINFTGKVNAIKIVGLDNFGASPGFDLTGAWGLEGSWVEEPQGPSPIPLPASLPLLLAGTALLAMVRRRRGDD